MTDFFGGQIPTLTPEDKDRLSKLYPKLKDNDDKLLQKYMDEIVNATIMRNFEKVKADVAFLVEKEYERTKEFAERDKERRKQEEGEE